jgi:broad specificity phosphatase PhoE
MTMPRTLTLVRHGESESNLAKRHAERGTPFANEAKLMEVHTSDRRLTPKGVAQAIAAGEWFKEWMPNQSTIKNLRCYVSPYVRAMETAGHMSLNDKWNTLRWRVDNRLCERNWGNFDQTTHEDRMKFFKAELDNREKFALFWAPPGGESLMQVFLRLRDFVGTLHRECEDMHVLVVSHGETMWAWRTLLEYWLPSDLREAMNSNDRQKKILNCRIIQYSRVDKEGLKSDRYDWVRFVNPRKPSDPETNLDWSPVGRRMYSDADLLTYAREREIFLETA